jgi:hypothetical protein
LHREQPLGNLDRAAGRRAGQQLGSEPPVVHVSGRDRTVAGVHVSSLCQLAVPIIPDSNDSQLG